MTTAFFREIGFDIGNAYAEIVKRLFFGEPAAPFHVAVVNTTAPGIGCVLNAENDRGARCVSEGALKIQAPGAVVDHFAVMICAFWKVFDQDCCRVVETGVISGFPGGFH